GVVVPGALAQIAVTGTLGTTVARAWGWSLGAGLVFGLALAVASTVVLVRTLGERGLLESIPGRVALGWLVVEDLFTVLALVLLPALAMAAGGGHAAGPAATAARGSLILTLGLALGKTAL